MYPIYVNKIYLKYNKDFLPKQYVDNKNKQTEQFINFLIIIFLILNLLLFCENLKSKSSLNNESIVEYTDIDYSHNNTNTFKRLRLQ